MNTQTVTPETLVSTLTPEALGQMEAFEHFNEIGKVHAIASHLGLTLEEAEYIEENGTRYNLGSSEYLACTDEEADELAEQYIEETLWAFNPSFLQEWTAEGVDEEVLSMIQEKCEGANDAIKGLVNWENNKEEIVNDAISADGRGHFLNHYDGDEYEVGEYFIYQEN